MAHLIAYAHRSHVKLFSTEPAKHAFQATLALHQTSRGPRPKRFVVFDNGKEHLEKPAEVIAVLRQYQVTVAERQRVTSAEQKVCSDLRAMLEAYQIPYVRKEVCGFCIGKGGYKPLNANFVRYDGGQICTSCAQSELRRELP